MQAAEHSELVAKMLDVLDEIRVILNQMQVAAESDTIHTFAQQGPADIKPVGLAFQCGIAALEEGGRTVDTGREEVGMHSQFPDLDVRGISDLPGLKTAEDAVDNPVKSHILKTFAIGFDTNPVVVVEHIGLLIMGMDQIDTLPAEFHYEFVDKVHPVAVDLRGYFV